MFGNKITNAPTLSCERHRGPRRIGNRFSTLNMISALRFIKMNKFASDELFSTLRGPDRVGAATAVPVSRCSLQTKGKVPMDARRKNCVIFQTHLGPTWLSAPQLSWLFRSGNAHVRGFCQSFCFCGPAAIFAPSLYMAFHS